jgi:DNA mismatch repair protein MutS
LRKIIEGAADRSYGIHVAQLAGLPVEITTRARVILRLLEEGDRDLGGSEAQLSLFGTPGGSRTTRAARAARPDSAHELAPAAGPAEPKAPRAALPPAGQAVIAALTALDPDHLTPLEALQTLAAWRRLLGAGSSGGAEPPSDTHVAPGNAEAGNAEAR